MRSLQIAAILSILVLTTLLAYVTTSVLAETTSGNDAQSSQNSAATTEQALQTPAGKFIKDLGDKAITVMADKSIPQEQRMQDYRKLLNDSFDMPTIGHFVLGRAWNTATPDQRDRFMKMFEQLVLQTYGDRLNFYSGEKFNIKSERQESDRDSVVSTEIQHTNGDTPPTEIDWRVRQEGDKLAVIDVVIEGISQSVTQRQEYASILQRNNGNMEALLDRLQQRLQQPQQQSSMW